MTDKFKKMRVNFKKWPIDNFYQWAIMLCAQQFYMQQIFFTVLV